MRLKLAKNQSWQCHWCGRKCHNDHKRDDGLLATIEHIIPKSRGGKDSWSNLVMSCRQCNTTRGCDRHRSLEEILTETVDPMQFSPKTPKRIQHYINKAKEMNETGWLKSDGTPLDKNEWVATLKIKSKHNRKKVYDAVFRGVYE